MLVGNFHIFFSVVAAESVMTVAIVYTAMAAAECRSSSLLLLQLLPAVIAAL
jgi:hypothetical protein